MVLDRLADHHRLAGADRFAGGGVLVESYAAAELGDYRVGIPGHRDPGQRFAVDTDQPDVECLRPRVVEHL